MAEKNVQNDFSKGNIPAVVMRMALPLIAAQLVNVLYNVVDRIYIGHIPNVGSMALTGVGIALPVISILSAFAGLFGQGGAPLCSMARGRGDNDEASRVMGNAFSMLLVSSVALGLLTWAFLDPVITVFAAGKEASSYAREYLAVYLIGTTFSFVSLGMNVYINAQGFATRGMLTVLLGAAANIVLDPLFIFAFRMGVRGAAAATVLSQALSAAWCFLFLRSSKTPLELSWRTMAPRKKIMGRIMSLGVADFVMGATNSAIQTVANRQLGLYGGDLYVGSITVVNSLRTIFTEIIHGFGSGIQPVLAFNYGAGQKKRVLETIRFSTLGAAVFSLLVWTVFMLFPEPLIRIFTPDEALIAVAVRAVRIYFCGFVFMSLQFVAQNSFRSLGKARQAIFFSLLRKIVLVVPLMLLLPGVFGLGADGVYWSEPISDLLGGGAAFTTLMLTVYRPLAKELKEETLCQN